MDQELRRLIEKYGAEAIQGSIARCANDHVSANDSIQQEAVALEASLDAVFLVNVEGVIVYVNNAALRHFGYLKKEELIGENCSILVADDQHRQEHDRYMKQFNDRGRTSRALGIRRAEMARRKDGSTFPCRLGVQKLPSPSKLLVGYIQDVTQEERATQLAIEKRAAEVLLYNMLPTEIAQRLKEDPTHIADHFAEATILFADIVGFTKKSSTLAPIDVVRFLNDIFSRFDKRLDERGLNKVKTIGDCYMVTSIPGMADNVVCHRYWWKTCILMFFILFRFLPDCKNPPKTAAAVCHFAMDMIIEIEKYNAENPEHPLNMRIGINTGPVVAGVVGTKRFLYDIWGDAVNVASRMESTGVPGRIQVTQAVVDIVSNKEFEFSKRGTVQVKGIGEMETYFLDERKEDEKKDSHWKSLGNRFVGTAKDLELLQSLRQLNIKSDN